MGLHLYSSPALPVFGVGSHQPSLHPPTSVATLSKTSFLRTLGVHRTVGEIQLTSAQGPRNLGLSVPSQILPEYPPGQPGGWEGYRVGLALGGWIPMRWWWVADGIRNSLSIRRAWGAQRGPGISTRLRAHFSPRQIRDWGGAGQEGGPPKERREQESHQGGNAQVWRGAVWLRLSVGAPHAEPRSLVFRL